MNNENQDWIQCGKCDEWLTKEQSGLSNEEFQAKSQTGVDFECNYCVSITGNENLQMDLTMDEDEEMEGSPYIDLTKMED